jgi:WD40 repeat protein
VLAAHPSDGSFAIGCADGTVRLCGPPRWADAVVLDGHVQSVMSVCFDSAGERLATAGLDGTAVALANGDFRGHGPADELIWRALGLGRYPLPPLTQEDVHG